MTKGFDFFISRNNSIDLNKKILATQEKKSYDDGSWKLEIDKEKGIGEAVIRFLPPKDTDLPYVKYYQHFFKGDDGSWCIVEKCPRTFNENCCICQCNHTLWNTGSQEMQSKARIRKARTQYAFNILVVNDKVNSANNGKTFIFKCGPAIFQYIMDAMKPEQEFGEEPKKPFDVYNGNNFILRARADATKGGMITYDKSKFEDKETPIAESDSELEQIYNSMKNLDEFLNRGKLSEQEVAERAARAYCNTDAVALVIGSVEQTKVNKEKFVKANNFNSDNPFDTVDNEGTFTPPWEDEKTVSSKVMPSEDASEGNVVDTKFFAELANTI